MNSEKFSLKWNDFQQTVSNSFKVLRKEGNFFDVTLVSKDESLVKGYKVVLSACSVFRLILKNSSATNSFIYLPGINSQNLEFIMYYIYQGEVMIFQEQLDEFLEVAQKLKIVGLNSDTNHEQVKEENKLESQNNHFIDRHSYNYENQFTNDLMKEDNILLAPVMNSSTQIKKLRYPEMDKTNLDEKIEEMISVVDGVFTCTICGTTCKQKVNLKKHIETHIEGLSFPCQQCDKTFRFRNSLQKHISTIHNTKF